MVLLYELPIQTHLGHAAFVALSTTIHVQHSSHLVATYPPPALVPGCACYQKVVFFHKVAALDAVTLFPTIEADKEAVR